MKEINKRKFIGAKAFVVAGALSQAVTGCANMPYPLSAVPPKPPSVASIPLSETDLPDTAKRCGANTPGCKGFEAAIAAVEDLRETYWSGYSESGNSTYWFDVPLLGLALAAVGAASYGAHTDLITGVGLGAAALGTARAYVNPNEVSAALQYGARATDCILSASIPMRDLREIGGTTTPYQLVTERLSDLRNTIADTQTNIDTGETELQANPSDAALKSAIASTKEAIKTALEATAVVEVERRAFAVRLRSLDAVVWTISGKVADRLSGSRKLEFGSIVGVVQTAITQAALKEKLSGEAGVGAPPTPQSGQVDSSATAILLNDRVELLSLTYELLDNMPDYTGASAAMAACSEV